MAQPQVQARENSGTDRRTTMPAAQNRSKSLAPRDALSWAGGPFGGGPFGLMRRLSDDMDQLFGQLTGGVVTGNRGSGGLASPVTLSPPVEWMPALEIFERDGKLVVQADLPGVAADDVTIEIDDNMLTVSGERREEIEVDDAGFRRTERRYGRFSRSVALPEGAKPEEAQAACRDGVLEITVPLQQQQQSSRRTIDIKSSPSDASSKASTTSSAQSGTDAVGGAAKTSGDTASGANTVRPEAASART
jgi:HSP20 family protein